MSLLTSNSDLLLIRYLILMINEVHSSIRVGDAVIQDYYSSQYIKGVIMNFPKGFTLIELLIVVSIIAILAAIAVPNFLEAQTRAKISRAEADMRNIAMSLESYFIDNNRYPAKPANSVNNLWQSALSTPVAYINSCYYDIFAKKSDTKNLAYKYSLCIMMKSYIFTSIGPDLVSNFDEEKWMCGMAKTYPMPYDPTNGTVSRGDIPRVNRQSGAPLIPPM